MILALLISVYIKLKVTCNSITRIYLEKYILQGKSIIKYKNPFYLKPGNG